MTATLGAVKNTKTATKEDEMSEADAGAIARLCENAWEEFIAFLHYDVEIRTAICSTNAIEALDARNRRAVKVRGHFPTGQAAIKRPYLVTRSLDQIRCWQNPVGNVLEARKSRTAIRVVAVRTIVGLLIRCTSAV